MLVKITYILNEDELYIFKIIGGCRFYLSV